jgi:hypothetical protein
MINNIIDGISLKLNQVFGDGYEIYGDADIVQGLKEPCFFIAVLNPSYKRLLGQRFQVENPFVIQFFPKKARDNTELHNIAFELFTALELITLPNGDLLHGTSMEHEIVDGVLNFKVNYNMILNKIEVAELMEKLKYEGILNEYKED